MPLHARQQHSFTIRFGHILGLVGRLPVPALITLVLALPSGIFSAF
jgi:hypothetical protein